MTADYSIALQNFFKIGGWVSAIRQFSYFNLMKYFVYES